MGSGTRFTLRAVIVATAAMLLPAGARAAPPTVDDKVRLNVTATVRGSAVWHGPTDKDITRNEQEDEFTSQLSETVEYRIVEVPAAGRRSGWRLEKLSHQGRLSISGGGKSVMVSGGLRNSEEWTYSMPGACPGDSLSRILRIDEGKATVGVSRFFLCKVSASGTERHVARWEPGASSPTYETNPVNHRERTWAMTAGNELFADFARKNGLGDAYVIVVPSASVPVRGGSVQFSGSGSHAFEMTDSVGRKFVATVGIQYTIQAGKLPPPRKPEVFLRPPADYEEWLPRDGNRTSATCAWKGDGATRVKFTLFEVSSEPGTCTNGPPTGTDAKRTNDADLTIEARGGFTVEKVGEGTWTATADATDARQSVLEIASHDYAAWGKVRCEVEVDHAWYPGRAGARAYLTIPRDENENGIGDAWEKLEGVKDKDVSEDTDKSSGNPLDGDGFTLFEEYRGFMVKGEFKRLKPARKDLFVVNNVGTTADAGIALFGKRSAADLDAHQIREDEWDAATRIVNFRKASRGRGGDQHGILLAKGGTRDAKGADAEAVTVPAEAGKVYTQSPGEVRQITFGTNFGSFGPAATAKDVAHELGHACGLKHHGDAAPYLSELPRYEKDGSGNVVLRDDAKGRMVRVYRADGSEVLERPFTIEQWQRSGPARGEGPASGDVNCIMNYDSVYSWSLKVVGGIILLANKPAVPPGETFCTSPKGTRYNAEGNRPFSLFGDALRERSNCKSRVRVKDW